MILIAQGYCRLCMSRKEELEDIVQHRIMGVVGGRMVKAEGFAIRILKGKLGIKCIENRDDKFIDHSTSLTPYLRTGWCNLSNASVSISTPIIWHGCWCCWVSCRDKLHSPVLYFVYRKILETRHITRRCCLAILPATSVLQTNFDHRQRIINNTITCLCWH